MYLIILIATVALFKIPLPFSTQMGYAKWTFTFSFKALGADPTCLSCVPQQWRCWERDHSIAKLSL